MNYNIFVTRCRSVPSANRFNGAHFIAPYFDTRSNLIADLARSGEAFFARADECSRVGKTPVQSLRHTGKNRATLGVAFSADRDHVRE